MHTLFDIHNRYNILLTTGNNRYRYIDLLQLCNYSAMRIKQRKHCEMSLRNF